MQENSKGSFSDEIFFLWRTNIDQAVENIFTTLTVESDSTKHDEVVHQLNKSFTDWKMTNFGENLEIYFTLIAVSNFPCSETRFELITSLIEKGLQTYRHLTEEKPNPLFFTMINSFNEFPALAIGAM